MASSTAASGRFLLIRRNASGRISGRNTSRYESSVRRTSGPYRCSYPSFSVRCSTIRFSYHSSFSGSMDVMLFREHSETVRDSTLETVIVHPTNIWILSQTIFRFSLSINLSSGCNQHECLLFLDYVMLSYFCSVEQEKRPQLKRRRAYYLFLSSTSQTQASHLDSRLEARRMIFSKADPPQKTHRTSDYRIHLSTTEARLSQALHLSPVHISAQSFKSFVFC